MKSTSLFSFWTAFRNGPTTYASAEKLAWLGCLAVGIRGIYTLFAFVFLRPSGEEVVAQLRQVRGPVTLDEAAIDQVMFERVADVFVWISGTMTGVVILISVGLGVWQWRRPNAVMPLICLGIIGFSTLLMAYGMMNEHVRAAAFDAHNLVLLAIKPVLAVLLIAAYRGGRFCQQYRKDLL